MSEIRNLGLVRSAKKISNKFPALFFPRTKNLFLKRKPREDFCLFSLFFFFNSKNLIFFEMIGTVKKKNKKYEM